MIADQPFRGGEAMACGLLNRHQLRTRYRVIFPGVYLDRTVEVTLWHRTAAAWLWSRRRGVIAGLAASAMLGNEYVNADVDIELFWNNTFTPDGIVTRREVLADDETLIRRGIRVTTPERTGFDLARRGRLEPAVAQVDALMHATHVKPDDIACLAARHPRARGLRQLERVLELADPKAESLWETWLRLLLRRAKFPPVETQFEVFDDGRFVARVDMAWPDILVAIEYDGDRHRTDRRQYVRDVKRLEDLQRLEWVVVRVLAGDTEADIIARVRAAIALQLSRRGRRD
ncbi:MAG: hypothetical protein ACSLE6_10975 [Mycobacterium sp.]